MFNDRLKQIFICIIVIVFVSAIQYSNLLSSINRLIEDRVYQGGFTRASNIYVIGIDEETLQNYGDFDSWSREKIADLINLLSEDPDKAPAVIAIDISYYSTRSQQEDERLIEAVKNAGNVVLIDTFTFTENEDGSTSPFLLEEPFDQLKEVAYATGHSNHQEDEDGIVRHAFGSVKFNGEDVHSFAYETYKAYLESKGETVDENSNGAFGAEKSFYYLTYSGKTRSYYGSVSAGCSLYKVLNGTYPTSAFKDSIVFIGAFASGMQDAYYASIDRSSKMNGVEIHANIVDQLLNGSYKTELSSFTRTIITIIVGIILVLITQIPNVYIVVILQIISAASYLLFARLAYQKLNVLFPIDEPLLLILLLILTYITYTLFHYSIERKEIIAKYSKFLPPEISVQIANSGEESLKLGGTKKDVTILFVDIRGFTSLSEKMKPEEVFEMLNEYFSLTTSAIFNNLGTVDKYIGDATMAIFNAPVEIDDHVMRAIKAGLEMANKPDSLDLPEHLKGKAGFGVGIHTGQAMVGNLGTENRMDYTAIGDVVNTASRLEGIAKAGNVVISKDVYDIVKSRIIAEDAGEVMLKGKEKPMKIYIVKGVVENE